MSFRDAVRTFTPISATLAVFLAIAGAGVLQGQARNGDLHGTVRDVSGASLPGVTIELHGPGATRVAHTDPRGEFRFLELAPGGYRVRATLEGYGAVVHERVTIAVGRNTVLEVTLPRAVEETIIVTSESPLLDERKISAGATVTRKELEKIPTARNPWVILPSVPGVLTSEVNVGGNLNGEQQTFTGSGASNEENSWAIDGVVITLMSGRGFSTAFFDFDALDEIEVSTGGSDVSKATGGVSLNLVTRRGTNEWRGSSRYVVADDAWQADLVPDAADLGAGQEDLVQGDRIVRVADYGLEGGGPLVRERLWGWGSFGRNDIDRLTIEDVREHTVIDTYGLKLNAELGESSSMTGFFHRGRKSVDGRDAGPTRPEPTTIDFDGITEIFKLEDTHVVGPRLIVTGLVSRVDVDLEFIPKGGIDGPPAVLDSDFVWRDNFRWSDGDRDQRQARLEGNAFLTVGEVAHELEVGAGYRRTEGIERAGWPGEVIRFDYFRSLGFDYDVAEINRQESYAFGTRYLSLFAQDTLRSGRLTVNLGLRFDRQEGRLFSASVPAVPGFEALPDGTPLFPAVSVEGRDQGYRWDDIAPRLGATWAVGGERQTLVRASFARFAGQLDHVYPLLEWPLGPAWAGFFYDDRDGDGAVSVDEIVDFGAGPLYTNGYDPLAREARFDVDPELEAPLSDELIFAVEHALLPELVVGLSATWRKTTDLPAAKPLVDDGSGVRPHRAGDYELLYVHTATLPDGSTSDVPVHGLRSGVVDTGRSLVANSQGETEYRGLSLTLDKRLSKRWMLRGHASWSDWTVGVPESENPNLAGRDGDPVLTGVITPGWSYRLGGLLQVAPERSWGFDLAANVWGRQGYAIPYYTVQVLNTAEQISLVAVDPVDRYRHPGVHLVDLRADKRVRLGDFEVTLGLECFNALNRSTVLSRNPRLGVPRTNWVLEVTSPRIFRAVVRLTFR